MHENNEHKENIMHARDNCLVNLLFVLSVDKNLYPRSKANSSVGVKKKVGAIDLLKYFCCFLNLDDLNPKVSCGLLRHDLSVAVFQQ